MPKKLTSSITEQLGILLFIFFIDFFFLLETQMLRKIKFQNNILNVPL